MKEVWAYSKSTRKQARCYSINVMFTASWYVEGDAAGLTRGRLPTEILTFPDVESE